MFESHVDPLLSQGRFVQRMLRFLLVGALTDVLVVLMGAVGFRMTVGLAWLDALVDAAMVVTGNGPRHPVESSAGKVFLVLYGLAGGTLYIVVVALVLAPALHRILHALHMRAPEDEP